jgi:Family of unknown function (DUF5681)
MQVGSKPVPFKPGQSGNPRGAIPKERALTNILARLGEQRVSVDGRQVAAKTFVAMKVWELVTSGQVTLTDRVLKLSDGKEWLEAVQWLYTHVDGPPRPVDPEPERRRDYVEELAGIVKELYAATPQAPPRTPAELSGLAP